MARVEGKVALVTGGASGIGLSSARLLAKEGAKVVIADFNAEGAQQAAAEINAQGGEAYGLFLDAGDESSIREAVEFTVKHFGTFTVLFNNVGLTNLQKDLDVVNMDLMEWDRAFPILLTSCNKIPSHRSAYFHISTKTPVKTTSCRPFTFAG
ncbi:SDR family NAD(P)-dependent oxidoreductase [Paenibacillus sp. OAE614]|uniref:SDR family NAD(P)-dependent oxidoreductase n=1 Tax=Paenibacillus sp. OAE614 TaxID=2663804 RepID=UPI00178A3CA8